MRGRRADVATRPARAWSALLLLCVTGAFAASGCDSKPTPKPFACAPAAADQEPIVELSRAGGMPAPRRVDDPTPPSPADAVLFAAWADCVLVFRKGDKLEVGHVPAAKMDELLGAIRAARFFDPPLKDGILFPDGPMQTLFVRDRSMERTLSHYGPTDAWLRETIAKTGPNAVPSKEAMSAFAAMWDKIVAAMDGVRPSDASPYKRDRRLRLRRDPP